MPLATTPKQTVSMCLNFGVCTDTFWNLTETQTSQSMQKCWILLIHRRMCYRASLWYLPLAGPLFLPPFWVLFVAEHSSQHSAWFGAYALACRKASTAIAVGYQIFQPCSIIHGKLFRHNVAVSNIKVLMSLQEWRHSRLPSPPVGLMWMTPFPLTLPIAEPQG